MTKRRAQLSPSQLEKDRKFIDKEHAKFKARFEKYGNEPEQRKRGIAKAAGLYLHAIAKCRELERIIGHKNTEIGRLRAKIEELENV